MPMLHFRFPSRRAATASAALAVALGISGMTSTPAFADPPPFNIVKPSTTGIPGEEVRVMTFDPEGNLWVFGRWPFWFEGGLAMLSADQLPYEALPSGGFHTGEWRVWSTVHHPIPSVFVSDIEFTADGIMWIASEGGLTRFDRHARTQEEMWRTYNAANSPLILNGVRSVDIDAQGNLWLTNSEVNSSNGALFRFNPATEQWTQFTVGQELPWDPPWFNVGSVLVGSDGHIWLTHAVLNGLAEFDGATWVLHEGAANGGMLEDTQGNIWIATANGLAKWNGASLQIWPQVGGTQTMTGLGLGLDGTVYVSTWYGGVYKMINDAPELFIDADNIPRNLIQRPNGEFWINNYGGNGTIGTVRHYDANGALLERMNTFNSGLGWYFVDNIQFDSAGNTWFASGEGGLTRMTGHNGAADQPTQWRNWGNHNDEAEPYPFAGNEPMYAMFEDALGNIWMGGNGVARWDPEAEDFTGFWNWQNSTFGVDDMNSFAQTPDGTIWVGCGYAGVFHFNPAANDWVQTTFGPSGWTVNFIEDMEVEPAGLLWVAAEGGLKRRNADGTWTAFPIFGNALEPDLQNGMWFGGSDLRYHDGTTWADIVTPAQAGWPGTYVTDIDIRESDGAMAISTQQSGTWPYTGGVSVTTDRGETWTHYTPQNSSLTHWQVEAVEFDPDGNLWASPISEGVVQILMGTAPGLPGDATGDGQVDVDDLIAVILNWGACAECADCPADFDGNCAVDVDDLIVVILHWK
jgi:ligand-binding sensor domain-containing protein